MNTQILEEASEWLVEFQTDDVDTGTRERFQAWLDASPQHIRAYLELTAVWEDSSNVDKARKLDAEALIAAAKADRNVYPFERSRRSNASPEPRAALSGWTRRSALAASFVVLMVAASATWYWVTYERGVYATTIGQQRTFALSDGTLVQLNADTRIRERFTRDLRTVELSQGQALFRVVKDPGRPFIVASDTASVRAVGTQFDVHRRATRTTVTVLEGRVAVTRLSVPRSNTQTRESGSAGYNAPGHEVVLKAGEQATVSRGSDEILQQPHADIAVATAWTQQNLIFQSATLADAAEEFNRFSTKTLVVAPQGLEDFRINGTFPALDPQSLPRFVKFLRQQPGITVVEDGERILVIRNR